MPRYFTLAALLLAVPGCTIPAFEEPVIQTPSRYDIGLEGTWRSIDGYSGVKIVGPMADASYRFELLHQNPATLEYFPQTVAFYIDTEFGGENEFLIEFRIEDAMAMEEFYMLAIGSSNGRGFDIRHFDLEKLPQINGGKEVEYRDYFRRNRSTNQQEQSPIKIYDIDPEIARQALLENGSSLFLEQPTEWRH